MNVKFRPHHFLCTLCFQGKGYSPAFVANYEKLVQQLQSADNENNLPIEVVDRTDSICAPCPHRHGALCETEEKVQGLDRAHAAALDLKTGDTLTWAQAKQRIKQKLTLPQFHQICSTCSWKSSGICEQTLKDFLT